MSFFSIENAQKAIDFGKKAASTYKAGQQAGAGYLPGAAPAGLTPIQNPITKAPPQGLPSEHIQKPAGPPKKAIAKKPAPKPAPRKPAPKAAAPKPQVKKEETKPLPEKNTFTIFGTEIPRSRVYIGSAIIVTLGFAAYAYKHR